MAISEVLSLQESALLGKMKKNYRMLLMKKAVKLQLKRKLDQNRTLIRKRLSLASSKMLSKIFEKPGEEEERPKDEQKKGLF